MKEKDLERLQHDFSISIYDKEDSILSLSLSEFFKKQNMEHLIQLYTPIIKAIDPKATAAFLTRKIGDLALAMHHVLSIDNVAVDFSPGNVTLQLYPTDETCEISFRINQWSELSGPTEEAEREEWLRVQFSNFYYETLRPLFDTISAVVELNAGQLWGQIPRKFDKYFERNEEKIAPEDFKKLTQDYEVLKYHVSAKSFGRKTNPFKLKPKMTESLKDPNQQIAIKYTCCLNYLIEGKDYCFSCPKLREKDREIRRQEYRLKHQDCE